MRVLIQRVANASVTIDGNKKSAIQKGLLIFVGIEDADNENDIIWLSNKIINLRIFDDENHVRMLTQFYTSYVKVQAFDLRSWV